MQYWFFPAILVKNQVFHFYFQFLKIFTYFKSAVEFYESIDND